MKDQHVSHYRLTEKLGAGTYGEVWKGVHVERGSFTVAIKLIAPELRNEPQFLAALEQECAALEQLDHPSIIRFRDLVIRDGTVAMVLEFLEGSELEALLAEGPQPVAEVVRILDKVLDGLAYAHANGVIHRDIKPANVFRCTDGRVKLLDFGIARAADGTQATQTGTLKGTLDYMSPERFANQTTPASDVYSVGLMAWELLVGRRAAPQGDLAAKVGWHMGVGIPDVGTLRTDCPEWLAEVVAALGAKEISLRPSDGAAALALLRSRRDGAASVQKRGTAANRPVAPETVALSAAALAAASTAPQQPQTAPMTVALVDALPRSPQRAGSSDDASSTATGTDASAPERACGSCGLPVMPKDRFCVGCGEALQHAAAAVVACEKCTSPMHRADSFCMMCGFARAAARD